MHAVTVPAQGVDGLSIAQAVDTLRPSASIAVIGAPLAVDADNFATPSGDLEAVLREVVLRVKGRQAD